MNKEMKFTNLLDDILLEIRYCSNVYATMNDELCETLDKNKRKKIENKLDEYARRKGCLIGILTNYFTYEEIVGLINDTMNIYTIKSR